MAELSGPSARMTAAPWLAGVTLAMLLGGCGTNSIDREATSAAPLSGSAAEPAAAGTAAAAELRAASLSEAHRPRFHFTPPSMWMNDPNGLVYHDGEYHLFYQHYPEDTVWGPMHWGHAVSTDLVHWEDLPIALYPDEQGYIFSGSAVVDWQNTSGFGTPDNPPLVAIFTYHDPVRRAEGTNDHESQGIAYSLDRGRSWTKYAGNPVLPNPGNARDFRDPNVFWHADSAAWIMVVSVYDQVELYRSSDLKSWSLLSTFGTGIGAHNGTWECPDLFPITVADSGETRWVLIQNLNPGGLQGGSGTQYFVGDFDGVTFTLDDRFAASVEREGAIWLDHGRDNYAGVTWSDIPAEDGRRIFIGWMSNWDYGQTVPTSRWRSAMTVPRELTLHETPEGPRLQTRPAAELSLLRTTTATVAMQSVTGALALPGAGSPVLADIDIAFDLGNSTATALGLELSNAAGESYRIGYDTAREVFFSDRRAAGPNDFADNFADRVHEAPRRSRADSLSMRLVIDAASIELFADDGSVVLTDIFFPSQPFAAIAAFADSGSARLTGASVHRLRPSWPP